MKMFSDPTNLLNLLWNVFFNIFRSFIYLFQEQLCWTLDVSRTASYEITLIRPSVRPSVRPSLNFLKIGSLVFSDIAHDS